MRRPVVLPVVASLALGIAAFSGSADVAAGTNAVPGASAAADPIGPACSSIPRSGSFASMATEPLVTAASNNPALSTLATAIKEAGLADKLNSVKDITVFAPTNDAFAKIPKAQMDKILADKKALSEILTYHIVGQRLTPEVLSSGTFKTLQGGTIRMTRSGDSYKVGDANVLCGNLPTANGTVYIIDSVLMPRS